MYECGGASTAVNTQRSKDGTWGSLLSFHGMGLRKQTQVVRVAVSDHLY